MSYRLLVCLFSLFFLFSCGKNPKNFVYLHGQTMGTSYNISIVASQSFDKSVLQKEINDFLLKFNKIFSTYIDSSEVAQINKKTNRQNVRLLVSRALSAELVKSLKISEETGGAFDITVAPLINLWGFDKNRHRKIPTKKIIAAAKNFTGYQRIVLDEKKRLLSIPKGFSLNFSAIAKGTAVDQLSAFLKSRDFRHYLIDIGGEVVAYGKNKNNLPWKINIAFSPKKKILISNPQSSKKMAIATSGNYFNYFEVDGVRYSHTIDPKTGAPVTHKLISVTVIASDCFRADALATALMVMGEKKGFSFANKKNLAVYFIYQDDNGRLLTKITPKFNYFFF